MTDGATDTAALTVILSDRLRPSPTDLEPDPERGAVRFTWRGHRYLATRRPIVVAELRDGAEAVDTSRTRLIEAALGDEGRSGWCYAWIDAAGRDTVFDRRFVVRAAFVRPPRQWEFNGRARHRERDPEGSWPLRRLAWRGSPVDLDADVLIGAGWRVVAVGRSAPLPDAYEDAAD